MLRDPRWRACVIFAPLCAVIGAVIGLVVVPAYIRWDILRQCGLHPFPSTMGRSDMLMFTAFLYGGGLLILGPALIFASLQKQRRLWQAIALLFSLFYPWGIFALVALLFTPPDGLWYRGIVNAVAGLSLPVLNWGLAMGLLNLLQRAGWFPTLQSNGPSMASQH